MQEKEKKTSITIEYGWCSTRMQNINLTDSGSDL